MDSTHKHDEGHGGGNISPSNQGHVHQVKVKKVERPTKVTVKMTLEVAGDIVKSHERHTSQRYAQQARIPGFRPGKAPLKMIQEKYRDDIRGEVVSHLAESGLIEALQETKLMPVNRPKIVFKQISFEGDKPFEFDVEFEVQPEIELKNYKGLKLKVAKSDVTEDEIKQTLENLRERLAVLQPIEAEKPEKGNFAVVEIGYEVATKPPKTEAAKPYTVEIGVGSLLPELDDALITMKVGETRQITAKFPDDYAEKTLAGLEAKYDCKIVELKKKVIPELNDAFAGQLKEGHTLAALTEEIRENIKSGKMEDTKREKRKQALDVLIEKNPFEVPASLVEDQMQRLMEWMKDDMKRRGMPLPPMKDKDFDELKKRAEHMVRGSMLLKEVATKEKISLDQTQLDQRVEEMAKQLNRSTEDTNKFLEGKGMLDRLKDEVLTDQVYDFLISNAEVTETSTKSS